MSWFQNDGLIEQAIILKQFIFRKEIETLQACAKKQYSMKSESSVWELDRPRQGVWGADCLLFEPERIK